MLRSWRVTVHVKESVALVSYLPCCYYSLGEQDEKRKEPAPLAGEWLATWEGWALFAAKCGLG